MEIILGSFSKLGIKGFFIMNTPNLIKIIKTSHRNILNLNFYEFMDTYNICKKDSNKKMQTVYSFKQ